MEDRAAKLALARKKLKDHQEKKSFGIHKDDIDNTTPNTLATENPVQSVPKSDEDIVINLDITNSEVSESVETGGPVVTNSTKNNEAEVSPSVPSPRADINITEILISNKRNLELQVQDLQSKLGQLELNHAAVINEYKTCNKKINDLENELININNKYFHATQEISIKEAKITELNSAKSVLSEENSNLIEQLEFTKTVVSAKEAETDSLHNQLFNLQNQYDVILLQLQQLTNGSPDCPPNKKVSHTENAEVMLQKISNLEQQLSSLQKERDQMNLHYEHYVAELNEQLRAVMKKNEDLTREVDNLSNRENSLIEQIGDMEIRIQNYKLDKYNVPENINTNIIKELQDELNVTQEKLQKLKSEHEVLQNQYSESIAKVKELSEVKEAECNHDNISLSKLNADMTSDKVAAQRATEQNKKLKQDLQGLEDDFVKMSKDKLELTEKITAEKYLNRELTIKLSEVEEKAKEMQIKLKAKDEEMIRLQSSYREMEKQCEALINLSKSGSTPVPDEVDGNIAKEESTNEEVEAEHLLNSNHESLTEQIDDKNSLRLQKEDAMVKLQDRFLKIMGEVADLSDEKHRLEHIILQLQNETETICEYVALYQQQRSLLKRRDEERSAQLKVFQQECGKLQSELEELTGILARFADDKELSSYFLTESKRKDMEKVMTLLSNLKNNSLIDPKKKNIDFKNFYPCNCCSGKLIEV